MWIVASASAQHLRQSEVIVILRNRAATTDKWRSGSPEFSRAATYRTVGPISLDILCIARKTSIYCLQLQRIRRPRIELVCQ